GDSGEVAIRVDLIDDQDEDAVVVGAGRDVPKPAGSLLSSGFRPGRRMGHEDDLRTGESLDSRGFGEVRVVTDLYADDCVLQAKDRQVASVPESADLACGDKRLSVRVEAASPACDQLCVVEDARGRALEHSGEDQDAELVRQGAAGLDEVPFERMRQLARDVCVGWVAAERELREADELRACVRGLSRELTMLCEVAFDVSDAASDLSRRNSDVMH